MAPIRWPQSASTVTTVRDAVPRLAFKSAAEAILQLAISANGHLNDTAPWSRMKQEGQEAAVGDDLYAVLEATRLVGVLLSPLVPDLSARILAQLGHDPITSDWDRQLSWGGLRPGASLPKPSQ